MSNCKDCRFFKPKFYQIGFCERQYSPGSKIINPDAKDIFVHISFGCVQFEPIPDTGQDTI